MKTRVFAPTSHPQQATSINVDPITALTNVQNLFEEPMITKSSATASIYSSPSSSTTGTPWRSATMASSTQRQNARLSALLSILNRLGIGGFEGNSALNDHTEISQEDMLFLGTGFEKLFSELQRLLGNIYIYIYIILL